MKVRETLRRWFRHPWKQARWWLLGSHWDRWEFGLAWHRGDRCAHVSRAGLPCFRGWTYDAFCGVHNSYCRHDSRRHPWRSRKRA